MTEAKELMAIIQGVGVGLRDVGRPVLWWSVHTDKCGSALHVFDWDTAFDIIKSYGVREVHLLNGKPCWVEVDGNRMTYKRACIIEPEEP